MRGSEFTGKTGLADSARAEAADAEPRRRKNAWVKWEAAAACLCLVAGAFLLFRGAPGQPDSVLRWSPGWEAEDYFQDCGAPVYGVASRFTLIVSEDRAEERVFSGWREQLEAEGIIPVIDSHPLFDCRAYYNDDGSVSCVVISWQRRGEMADYSDLMIIAGPQEVEKVEDYAVVQVDENGNVIKPRVTVTERDGVQIVAEGGEGREKTITFQSDHGWYQVFGSFNDGYEPVVELLDWLWEHPLDFTRFPMEAGDVYEPLKSR